ncbi:hypothetical protein V1509DRAFT_628962 [Lipomyces kononenkoae]
MDSSGDDFYHWLVFLVLIITSSFFACSLIVYPPRRPSVRLSDVFVNAGYAVACRLVDVMGSSYHLTADGDPVLYEFPYQPIRRKGIIKFVATKSLTELKRSHLSTIFFAVILVSAALAFGFRGWKLYNIGNDNYPRMTLLAVTFLAYCACFVSMDWLVRQNRSRGNRKGSATILFNANERTWIRSTDSVIRLNRKLSLPVKWIPGFVRMAIAAIGSLVSVLGYGVATWSALAGEDGGESGEFVARVVSVVVCTIAAIISSLAMFKCCKRAMNSLTAAVTNVELEFGSEVHTKETEESIIHVEDILKAFVREVLDPLTDVLMSGNGGSYDFAIITVDGGVVLGRMRPSRTRT